MSFHCPAKMRGNKCPYKPFKNKFHMNDYMRKFYFLLILKINRGPMLQILSRNVKKNKRMLSSKAMIFKIMTSSFKMIIKKT